MTFVDFAPNEQKDDAIAACRLLFQPWRWRRGKETTNLKRRLKSRFFSPDTQISLFFSARGALYQYLKTLHLPPESVVLIQAITSVTTVVPILANNLTPVYVDINETDFSMDIRDLEKKYSKNAKVLILQHTCGITPVDRKKILAFAKTKKLKVIEDITQGFDPELFKNKRFTSLALMSFNRNSAFSSVFGGMLAIRGIRNNTMIKEVEKNIPNPSIWLLLQMLFYKIGSVIIKKTYSIFIGKLIHFAAKQLNIFPVHISKKERKGEFDPTYLKTFPNLSAQLLLKQLDRFNDVSSKRTKSVVYYNDHLGIPHKHSAAPLGAYPVITKQYNPFQSSFRSVVDPAEDPFIFGYQQGTCPIAEKIIPHLIKLPTLLQKKEREFILKQINRENNLSI